MQAMKCAIAQSIRPVHAGDWHDKPLRWAVIYGPGFHQMFVTRKNAELFARILRKSDTVPQAMNRYYERTNQLFMPK